MIHHRRTTDNPGRAAVGLVVLLALVLPFEAPLFHLGPLLITTVECILYATIALAGPRLVAFLRDARKDTLVQAGVAWSVVSFVSAVAAHDPGSIKFALRTTSGVLVFLAVRSLASPPHARRVLLALGASALVSAATGVLDWLVPATGHLWNALRAGAFDTYGLPRPSGVFAYPTIGSMYWEATLPLVLVAPVGGGWARTLIALVGGSLLIVAILASGTRAGLVTAGVACIAMVALAPRPWGSVQIASAGCFAVLVVSCSAALGSRSLLGERLRWWHDDQWFKVAYSVDDAPRTVHPGEIFTTHVTLHNTGTLPWPHAGPRPVRLAYHMVDVDGLRTELPVDVPPGGEVVLEARAYAPWAEGAYELRWDLVQEQITWFGQRGNPMPSQRIDVVGASSAPAAESATLLPAAPVSPPPRRALWHAAVRMWRDHPILGVGPDGFRHRYEALLSPGPDDQPYTDERIHANSLYFETLADLGLVGLAALAWLGLAWARALRARLAAADLLGIACGVGVGAFFVHGALDYFFEFTPLFGLFWILLGVMGAARRDSPT